MAISRRLFGSLVAGAGAVCAGVRDKTQNLVKHKVLRHPYQYAEQIKARPYWLYDAVYIRLSQCGAPIKITAAVEGKEPALQVVVTPRPKEWCMLLGLHKYRAEQPVQITLQSSRLFVVDDVECYFMRPDFERKDGMIIFRDKFYQPVEEQGFDSTGHLHHRVRYGPGVDVGYSGSRG